MSLRKSREGELHSGFSAFWRVQVPEFADVKRQLGNLEDRLEGMVQPKLSEALLARKVEETQKLRNILIAINRFSSLEQQYTRVRMRPLRKVSVQPPEVMDRLRSQKSRPVCCRS